MGVFEERPLRTPGMHWQQQQHERYVGPAYDPSRDLSPNLPAASDAQSMCDIDPGSNNNNNNHNHNNNNNRPSSSSTCLLTDGADQCGTVPKIEPPPTPPPGSSCEHQGQQSCQFQDQVATCAGCGQRITDRFYLQAVDRRWHAACLQCCQCRRALDTEMTCFARDGNIYCKKDYYRLFGMKRCARCQAAILSSELVMRARELVFHVHCFTCAACQTPLTKGDHFGMRDATVFCRLHFELEPVPPPGMPSSYAAHVGAPHHYAPPFPSPDFHHQHVSTGSMHQPPPGAALDCSQNKVPYNVFNGAPTGQPRQKGRPRKRKPKDLESMTASLDLNSDYLDMPFGRSPGTPGMGSNQRAKRMRTSFKHHQLRTMKSYFAINHNPDAKDLKQLSQKTGLPKRVLQVWFQNARAKWRRMMLKQEGKSGDKCSGSDSGGLADLDIYPQGPGSLTGSIQSLPPHSPPFMLSGGPNSPSTLDCP